MTMSTAVHPTSSSVMAATKSIYSIPQEIILRIFSYLDIPDLENITQLSETFAQLAQDPILHRERIHIVTPARVDHALFAHGGTLRPTIGDLAQWGIMRGLGIERRWRDGLYLYSAQSVKHYELSLRLERSRVHHILSFWLSYKRAESLRTSEALINLHNSRILPDIESSNASISRSLLPTVRKLKWSIQRDKLAKVVRDREYAVLSGGGLKNWVEGAGRGIMKESERLRLALCPDVKQYVRFWESMSGSSSI